MSFWNILKPRGLRSSRAILARKSRFDSQYSCDKRFLFRFSFLLFTVASWFFWFWNVFLFRNVRNFNLFKSERNSNNTLKTDMKMSIDENVQYYWRTMRKLCFVKLDFPELFPYFLVQEHCHVVSKMKYEISSAPWMSVTWIARLENSHSLIDSNISA